MLSHSIEILCRNPHRWLISQISTHSIKAVSNGDGVPHEGGGTDTEEEEADKKVLEVAAGIHLQILQEGEMDNRYPN
jgi:hypothetical protein